MKFQTAFDTIASFLVRNNATTLEIEALNCMASYCKSVETRSRKRSRKPAAVTIGRARRFTLRIHASLPPNSKRDQQTGRVRRGRRMRRKPSSHPLVSTTISTVWQMSTVRTPEAIAKRLVKLGKFKALDDVPGYIEYRQAEAKKKGGTYTPREARGR